MRAAEHPSSSTEPALKRVPLHDLHVARGAKMVPFAGYEMPVQYIAGVLKEHLHTRALAGLFDVSHMGQIALRAKSGKVEDAARALETLVPQDILSVAPGRQRYAQFTNASGGLLDDLMVANFGDHLFLVVNAACKAEDEAHLRAHLSDTCTIEPLPDRALIALQGPKAVEVLAKHAPGLAAMRFMDVGPHKILGIDCFVSRSGYTGEDGFEISVPAKDAERLATTLLSDPAVLPIGLGARDSLRLEAGLCLHGHDIDDSIDPAEAALLWSIGKRRKEARDFPGGEKTMSGYPKKKLVGIRPEGRAPAREGTEIARDGRVIGKVTSGGFGPSVNGPVAMGYVETAFAAIGTALDLMVRGQAMPAVVAALPFVPHTYKR